MRRAVLLALSLLFTLAVTPAVTPAFASEPQWTLTPASGGGTRPSSDGRPYFYLEGAPGTVLQDTLSLTNPGAKPVTVRLRGAQGYNTAAGSFAVRPLADSWITPLVTSAKVPPHTRADIPFSITVPAGAEPGDHPAAVVASAGGREVGVRIQLRVSGPTLSALTVEDISVDKSAGLIRYTLVNRGNTTLTPRLAVRAEGVFGRVLNRPARNLPLELLPAQRVALTEKWPDKPLLDSVDVHLTATAEGAPPAGGDASATFVPWGLLAGAGLLVAGAAAGAHRLVRRRGGPDGTGVMERELAETGAST
ncbi:COG1470 family protein [Streptomyces beijiangensis]|uniref:DUF916 domain-containing protein n=1 Tax=Streptomyces beijiangensis TaxID=163361 RepID=A0A939F1C6_9ACTN|nr:hypothetical protein [Streptomyces beijiangensis]MBO0510337.1 hypothetical protein [Streptomyces beijiangensis]